MTMTVQELIDELEKVKDKSIPVFAYNYVDNITNDYKIVSVYENDCYVDIKMEINL